MPLPTLSKTWQFAINQTVAAQGTLNATEKRLLRTVKNILIGFASNPWAVRSSCDGAGGFGNGDEVDRWVDDGDIVKANAGSNHSWIVLRQTGIASNFEICIDCNNASNSISVVVSPSAGFGAVAGTATARPTATDEIVLLSAAQWFRQVEAQYQIHAMQSSDGQCTRLVIWTASTIQCTFWLFDKPASPTTGWVNPSVFAAVGSSITTPTFSVLENSSTVKGRGITGATMSVYCTGEANSSFRLSQENPGAGSAVSDFDGAWAMFPIGLNSVTSLNKGRLGVLADLWWKPVSIADGDTLPNDAGNRQFAALGPLIFPWDGGAAGPLLV